jgi:putative cardiolipin synthase
MRRRRRTSPTLLLAILVLAGCTTLPRGMPHKRQSVALEPCSRCPLGEVTETIRDHQGPHLSGYKVLDGSAEALDWRLALVDHARETLDAQYFIWNADASGLLLLDRMLKAADRGVRVRLLIDDLAGAGGDRGLAALDSHSRIEVRIFNPWTVRSGPGALLARGFEFLLHMKQLNHRMHNKLLVADNQLGIVGGRNIGDEYFGLDHKFNFRDLDLLTAGPIVAEITDTFDLYWNSDWVYPAAGLATNLPDHALPLLRQRISQGLEQAVARLASFAVERQDWTEQLQSLTDEMSYGKGRVVYDHLPADEERMRPVQVAESFRDLDPVTDEVHVVSAYFIPNENFLGWLSEATASGVRVKILTNSLASNDESVTNSGYKKYRRPVLERGGELFEMRRDPELRHLYETPPVTGQFLGLHTKAIAFDGERVFVGSLNLDPRSIYLNTEMGLIIEDPLLGRNLVELFEEALTPENAWRVFLDSEGGLRWESDLGVVRKQPARSGWQRVLDGIYSLLPLENQL